MKAQITAKTELRLPNLVKTYTFNIIDDEDTVILSDQHVECRPSEVSDKLLQIVTEYQAAFEEDLDINIGDVVNG